MDQRAVAVDRVAVDERRRIDDDLDAAVVAPAEDTRRPSTSDQISIRRAGHQTGPSLKVA